MQKAVGDAVIPIGNQFALFERINEGYKYQVGISEAIQIMALISIEVSIVGETLLLKFVRTKNDYRL